MALAKRTQNLDYLLIIRALACLSVIWSHTFPGKAIILGIELPFIFPSGHAAVFVFYLLSGYGIGLGFNSKKYHFTLLSLLKFYFYRFLRIAPAYYLVIAVSLLVLFRDLPIHATTLVKLLTFTANETHLYSFFGPLTIISTEMQFYLISPLLFLILKFLNTKLSKKIVFLLVIIIGNVLRLKIYLSGGGQAAATYSTSIYTNMFGNLDLFLMGMLISTISMSDQIKSFVRARMKFLIRIYPLIILAWFYWANFISYYVTNEVGYQEFKYHLIFLYPSLTSVIMGMCVLFIVTINKSIQMQINKIRDLLPIIFSNKQIFAIGILSYGIYLWHYPIMYYLFYRQTIIYDISHALYRFAIVFLASYGLSFITYFLIELPFYKLRNLVKLRKTS